MSDTRKVRLWFKHQSTAARRYCKLPPERNPSPEDDIWLPLSQIEHTSKRGNEHVVTIPEWLAEEKGL
jgi:hypothetical protein